MINIGFALVLSAIGLGLVFAVLIVIMIFIKILGAAVSGIEAAANKPKLATAEGDVYVPADVPPLSDFDKIKEEKKQEIPVGMKRADFADGSIKLYDVDDKTAAMIMAIVADDMQTPIEELEFKSIKKVS